MRKSHRGIDWSIALSIKIIKKSALAKLSAGIELSFQYKFCGRGSPSKFE
jgi:hypothetical protein